MTQNVYVIGNTTVINGDFSFQIFNTYYETKKEALDRAKSEAEASLNNYRNNNSEYFIDTVTTNDPDPDDRLDGYSVCNEHGGPVDIFVIKEVHPKI